MLHKNRGFILSGSLLPPKEQMPPRKNAFSIEFSGLDDLNRAENRRPPLPCSEKTGDIYGPIRGNKPFSRFALYQNGIPVF